MNPDALRHLPPVHTLIKRPELAEIVAERGHDRAVAAVRAVLEAARVAILAGETVDLDPGHLARAAAARLPPRSMRLRSVVNATGILLHTGLGRAPLARAAAEAVDRVVRGYCNLEFDLDSGQRGRRGDGVADSLRELTGAEAALVVNNNAAATILSLRATARDREVIVSRGQLVEIGGSFRLPEIFEVSGAKLREVGTTNRTRLADYERAIGPDTAALLRVHPSNYRVVGFTESVTIAELARLGQARNLATIDDIGSGALNATLPPTIAGEPTVAAGLAAGADLILFSGDKLLGGPQCGIVVGKQAWMDRLARDPLMRAFRVDKMTLATLEATLLLILDGQDSQIPLWNFLTAPLPRLMERAEAIAGRLRREQNLRADAIEATGYLGGGSVPVEPIRTAAVRLIAPFPGGSRSESETAARLRNGTPSVVPRLHDGAVLLDLRAVAEHEDAWIIEALHHIHDTKD